VQLPNRREIEVEPHLVLAPGRLKGDPEPVGIDLDPVVTDEGDDEVLSFGPQRPAYWSRWEGVLTRRGVRWALLSAVAMALAVVLAATWQHAARQRAVAPVPSPSPAAAVPSSADEYVLAVPAVDLSGVLGGPQCPVRAGCSVVWLADGRLAGEMSAFFDVDTAAGGLVVDSSRKVIFQSVEVRNPANVLIHLVAGWSPGAAATAPTTGPTVFGAAHEGAVTVRVTSVRKGWTFTATVTGRGADKLPLEQAQRWVRTSPPPALLTPVRQRRVPRWWR